MSCGTVRKPEAVQSVTEQNVVRGDAVTEETFTYNVASTQKVVCNNNSNLLKQMHIEKKTGRKYAKTLIPILSNHFLYTFLFSP